MFFYDNNIHFIFYNKLNFVDGSHFDNLGSMQVMSLNLPRAAYRALDLKQRTEDQNVSDEELFTLSLNYLKELIDQCVRIFEIKQDSDFYKFLFDYHYSIVIWHKFISGENWNKCLA